MLLSISHPHSLSGKNVKKWETLMYYCCKYMWVWLLWKAIWQCLLKLKICVPFDPVSPLPGTHPRERLACVHRGRSSMFTTAAEHPIWLYKLCYLHTTGELCSNEKALSWPNVLKNTKGQKWKVKKEKSQKVKKRKVKWVEKMTPPKQTNKQTKPTKTRAEQYLLFGSFMF